MDTRISKSNGLHGEIRVPGDKSISHRALMIGALADGTSEIHGLLDAADPRSTMHCLRKLGIEFERVGATLKVKGKGLHGFRASLNTLDAGNSGTTMRLLSGILAGQPFSTTITGDDSLRRRPMKRIIEPLSQMGATIESTPEKTAPLCIRGMFPLRPINYQMQIASAQVKSAILLAGLFADGTTRVYERARTRDHTERMLGLSVTRSSDSFAVEVKGGTLISAQQFQVPGDISSAAFFIAAALIVPKSEVRILNVGLNPTRTKILDLFRSIGGSVEVSRESIVAGEPFGDLLVKSSPLKGEVKLEGTDAAELIDEIPILAATLAVGGVSLQVRGASELRGKESDRIRAIVVNLRKLGLDVEEHPDGFAFQPKNHLISAECDSFGDHRIAMAFGIAGLALEGEILIKGSECVDISYPGFWNQLCDPHLQ
jgi:3-phosphoshikimate 1-carboxyvinyltransferase